MGILARDVCANYGSSFWDVHFVQVVNLCISVVQVFTMGVQETGSKE